MKELTEMTPEEIKKAIQDETPSLIYQGLYRPYITEKLKSNNSYCEIREAYTELAKEFRKILKIIDKQPETAGMFSEKAEAFTKIMEFMRMLADFECAELIGIIREEEKTGDYLLSRQTGAISNMKGASR